GPTVTDVVANLERFVVEADQETIRTLREGLRGLGLVAPLLSGDVETLSLALRRKLAQRDASPIKTILDSMHKVAVLGYYAEPKADALVEYARPKIVPRARVCLPTRSAPSPRVFDVAIVGAGVAGSVLAERLTAAGKSVLVLEAGPY